VADDVRTISRQECHALASLSRLSLSDAEADRFGPQIGAILEYVRQLAAVDVAGVPEYVAAEPHEAPLRPDVPGASLSADTVAQQAPAVRGHHVVVPKFKED
jgi:aspartyl-tRNA(Asn)/glutamyl-tRNA(Gln) amidotransferase subunit C